MFGLSNFIGPAIDTPRAISLPAIAQGTAIRSPAHRVYTKALWEDDWTYESNLKCNWAEWALSPNLSFLELEWKYGRMLNSETNEWVNYQPYEMDSRRYVKVVVDDVEGGSNRLTWYGMMGNQTVEDSGYRLIGESWVRTGKQVISCISMIKTLLDTRISTSHVYCDTPEAHDIKVLHGLTFNSPLNSWKPSGNRSSAKLGGSYLFSNVVRENDDFWRVGDIVEYLLHWNEPKSSKFGTGPFGWWISEDSLSLLNAGAWRPVVETEGRTVKDILDQIIPRKRLLAYYEIVDEEAGEIELRVVSLTHRTIADSSLIALPNDTPVNIEFDTEQGDSAIYINNSEPVDRVFVRGAKARIVFSISNTDENLVPGWTKESQDIYNAGGSDLAEYKAATSWEKMREINNIVRNKDSLREVYSYFKLPDEWDHTAGDGKGNDIVSIFPSWLDWLTPGYYGFFTREYQREHFLLSELPLLNGIDYTGGIDAEDNIEISITSNVLHDERPPLIAIASNDQKYYDIEKIGYQAIVSRQAFGERYDWQGNVTVPPRERGFYITTSGEPQHIIAKDEFDPLPEDKGAIGLWNWKNMIATVAMELQVHCEGQCPIAAFAGAVEHDYARELVIPVGDEYRLDWIHPNTMVGIGDDKQPIYCTTGGYINNDVAKLRERAKLAYSWYKDPRISISLTTRKVGDYIPLGAMVRYYGHEIDPVFGKTRWVKTNSVISSIRVTIPYGSADSPPSPSYQTYLTEYVYQPEFA